MTSLIVNFLANLNFLRPLICKILRIFGLEIPSTVRIEKNLVLAHGGNGVVLHPRTVIGRNVKIYQQVTIGRSDIWNKYPTPEFRGVRISDNVIICAGAKVITDKELTIGRGCIIGANSVLTKSTGEYEVWCGVPAKKIRDLKKPSSQQL